MNCIFAHLLRNGVIVFMDDILVYSATFEEHLNLLQQVFLVIREHQFFLKRSKCFFDQTEVEYLGHCISGNGVATESSKIAVVQQWPRPKNLKELRGFLGLTGYYRKFIKHYGLMSKPLSDPLKKAVPFQWTSITEESFQQLKNALVNAPVLAIPDFKKQFVLETDASATGFGAVLMQEGHPVAYLSKAMCAKNPALSTYEKECMAIIMAVDKWRPYLQHQEIIVRTDHKSLLHLTEQRVTTKIQQKALLKLMDLKFKIQYKQGISNQAADSLSRFAIPESESVLAISMTNPDWLEKVKQGYLEDPVVVKLLDELASNASVDQAFALKDGIIRHKGRIWLGNNSIAHQHMIQSMHSSGLGGHSGFQAFYFRIKQLFTWPGMKTTVRDYIKACQICHQAKVEHCKASGLLQPLLVPQQAWKVISMDIVEGLPKSSRFDTIMMIIDKYTEYGHFIPLAHPFTAIQVAQAYMDHVYKLHGMPNSIISDRDRIFTSAVWRDLFKLTDTQLLMSSSYHLQTDGQTERLNQCLEGFLRCSVHSCPKQWAKWLSLAEFWYNTSYHSSLGRSLFEVLYGHSPRHFGISNEV